MALGTQQLQASLSHRYSNVWQAATLGQANHGSSCSYLWIVYLSSNKMSSMEGQLCHALFFLLSILIMQQLNNTNTDAFCCWPEFRFQSIDEVLCKGKLATAIIRRLISYSLSECGWVTNKKSKSIQALFKKQWITKWHRCNCQSTIVSSLMDEGFFTQSSYEMSINMNLTLKERLL